MARTQTHPRQGQPDPAQGLNTPAVRIVSAQVFRGDVIVHDIGPGITQFQILPNGQGIHIFKEDEGAEYTVAFSADTSIVVLPGQIETVGGIVAP